MNATPDTQQVLQWASCAAARRGDTYVRLPDVLAGLAQLPKLQEPKGANKATVTALTHAGIIKDSAPLSISSPGGLGPGTLAVMPYRYSEAVKDAIREAEHVGVQFGCDFVAPSHLLYALVSRDDLDLEAALSAEERSRMREELAASFTTRCENRG